MSNYIQENKEIVLSTLNNLFSMSSMELKITDITFTGKSISPALKSHFGSSIRMLYPENYIDADKWIDTCVKNEMPVFHVIERGIKKSYMGVNFISYIVSLHRTYHFVDEYNTSDVTVISEIISDLLSYSPKVGIKNYPQQQKKKEIIDDRGGRSKRKKSVAK